MVFSAPPPIAPKSLGPPIAPASRSPSKLEYFALRSRPLRAPGFTTSQLEPNGYGSLENGVKRSADSENPNTTVNGKEGTDRTDKGTNEGADERNEPKREEAPRGRPKKNNGISH